MWAEAIESEADLINIKKQDRERKASRKIRANEIAIKTSFLQPPIK